MFKLKLSTDPRWVNIVEKNIEEILTDHAYCEQKAASNAISIIVKWPEHSDMVTALLEIAQEELTHFKMVHDKLLNRGYILGRERKDPYVNLLYDFMKKGGDRTMQLIDRLMFGAMIEARSCERFKVLSEEINDIDLKEFYRELMISEANHYTVFLGFAKKYGEEKYTENRWNEWLEYEGEIIRQFGVNETMHG
ncbi:MAG: tRNA-(ms[2]io[6]A)-hydroxylase [Bacteroidota bacterium]